MTLSFVAAKVATCDLKNENKIDFSKFLGNPKNSVSLDSPENKYYIVYCLNKILSNFSHMNLICFPPLILWKPPNKQWASKPYITASCLWAIWTPIQYTQNSSSIASRILTQQRHKFPIDFNGPSQLPLIMGQSALPSMWYILEPTQLTTPNGIQNQ